MILLCFLSYNHATCYICKHSMNKESGDSKWRQIISVVGNSSLPCPFPFVLWTPFPSCSPDFRPEACSDLKFECYFDSASPNLSLWWLRYQLTARIKRGVKFFFMTVKMKVSTFFLLSVARNSLKWLVNANFVLSVRICGHRSSCVVLWGVDG